MFYQQKYDKIMKGLVEIQRNMRLKLNHCRKMKRMKNIMIIQAYVQKTICRRNKQKIFKSL